MIEHSASRAGSALGTLATDTVIRGRAPLRISFGGGGTDLMPYAAEHGGIVLSATIQRYAHANLRLIPEDTVQVRSLDYDLEASYDVEDPFSSEGKLGLVKACIRRLRVRPEAHRGLELSLDTEAPPGSGLGSSSALVVAIIGAFATWLGLKLTPYEVARLAYQVEREDVGLAGGMQDQYAAAFGGFNLMEFHGDGDAVVNPLRLNPDTTRELEYCSLLVFTGTTRQSSNIIAQQIDNYRLQRRRVVEALHTMKALALDTKRALLLGEIAEMGRLLDEQWRYKQSTAREITTEQIDTLYSEALRLGGYGGKISGAGGGGFLYLVAPYDAKPAIASRLHQMGATVHPVVFESEGMQGWVGQRGGTPGAGGR